MYFVISCAEVTRNKLIWRLGVYLADVKALAFEEDACACDAKGDVADLGGGGR